MPKLSTTLANEFLAHHWRGSNVLQDWGCGFISEPEAQQRVREYFQ
jgi:hypothetical protein